MSKYKALATGDVFPAYWTDAIQEFTGTLVSGMRLTTPAANIVRVVASTGSDQVSVGVNGLFRYRSSNTEVTITGATGTYNLYVAVAANTIAGVTDTTDYAWYLYFGTTAPTGNLGTGAAISATRKIGEVDWDNTNSTIIGLRQTVAGGDVTLPITPTASTAAVTPLTVRGTTSQSGNLIAVGSSSSSTDRLTVSSAGKLGLPVTGNTGGLVIGGDAALYRSATNTLKTDTHFVVGAALSSDTFTATTSVATGALTATGNASITGTLGVTGATTLTTATVSSNTTSAITLSGAAAGITFGTTGPANLYRSTADTLKTDDALIVMGVLSASATGKTAITVSDSGAQSSGLTIGGDTTLYRSAATTLKTDAAFVAAGTITGNAVVSTTSVAAATLSTSGTATVNALSSTTSVASATLSTTGNATVGGTLGVTGATTLSGATSLTAAGTALAVTNNATVGGTLGVTGTTTLGVVNAGGAVTLTAAGTALSVSNNASVGGTFAVTGATTLSSTLGFGAVVNPLITAQQVAAQPVVQNKLLNADANAAFRFLGDGKHEWGAGGATAVDTNLYRSAADTLKTDDAFVVGGNLTVVGNLITQGGSGTTQTVLALSGTGKTTINLTDTTTTTGMTIGGDTTLYRNGASTLKTDGAFVVAGTSTFAAVAASGAVSLTAAGTALSVSNNATIGGTLGVTGNATLSGTLSVSGAQTFTGATTHASTLTFSAATAGALISTQQVTGATVLQNKLLGADANPSFRIVGSGGMEWGAGGASAADTNLYRTTPGNLRTDSTFQVGGALTAAGGTTLSSTLNVTSATTLNSTLNVTGTSTLGTVSAGAVSASSLSSSGTLSVSGTSTVAAVNASGLLHLGTVAATANTVAGSTVGDKIALWSDSYGLGVQNSTLVAYTGGVFAVRAPALTGQKSSGTDVFSVAGSTGNTIISGTLSAGATSVTSLSSSGNVTANGSVTGSGSNVQATSPTLSGVTLTGTTSASTLSAGATTVTSLSSSGNVSANGGVTGTGSNVQATSPTIASPTLTGTTAASALTVGGSTVQGLAFTAVPAWWTTSSTGTGSNVLATSPTMSGVTLTGTTTTSTLTAGATSATSLTVGGSTVQGLAFTAVPAWWTTSSTGSGGVVLASAPTITNLSVSGYMYASGHVYANGAVTGSGANVQKDNPTITAAQFQSCYANGNNAITFNTASSTTADWSSSLALWKNPSGHYAYEGTWGSTVIGGTTYYRKYIALITSDGLTSGGTGWAGNFLAVNGGAYNTWSDGRFKTDVTPIEGSSALDIVRAMRGVRYRYDTSKNEISDALADYREVGFIAQDVYKVLPEVVDKPADDKSMWSLDYTRFAPVHNEAISELARRLEAAEAKIAALENG